MAERVSVEINDHIAVVKLNRAKKYNAFDPAMFAAVSEAGESLRERSDVRVVILCGAGGNFSAGLDIGGVGSEAFGKEFMETGAIAVSGTPANRYQHPAFVWRSLPMPVIAAIDGVCFGAGMQVAAGADIRIAAPDAKLSIMEIKWGLVPDMGITAVFRDIVRVDHLKELCFTARVVSGQDAVAWGLASHCEADPFAAAMKLAKEITGRGPNAVAGCKRLINEGWHLSEEQGLQLEASIQRDLIGAAEQTEAGMANMQKRAPVFADRKI